MVIQPASQFLKENGLVLPSFTALDPSVDNYRVLLFQPHGQIEVLYEKALPSGVRNKDRDLMRAQFESFINLALESVADLAITPEYSMPWEVLINAIANGISPKSGKLWVFGCESIKYAELLDLKNKLMGQCEIIFENLTPNASRFLDPLAYVFRAIDNKSKKEIVTLLVQFKTCAMGDKEHFEINGLQCGTKIFEFSNPNPSVRLVSLICSDVFDFETKGLAKSVYDRALIIHIQLQKDPRHDLYRKYRNSILYFGGDTTEVLCLNWSKDVEEWNDGKLTKWNNISGSAWYLKSLQLDINDDTLCQNHQNGLYYTRLESLRAHALFFNYLPAVHLLVTSKVFHHGVEGSRSQRVGPKLIGTWIWNAGTKKLDASTGLADGFDLIVEDCGDAKEAIKKLAKEKGLFLI